MLTSVEERATTCQEMLSAINRQKKSNYLSGMQAGLLRHCPSNLRDVRFKDIVAPSECSVATEAGKEKMGFGSFGVALSYKLPNQYVTMQY